MISVVADTNVLVSAVGWNGTPAQILAAARTQALDIVLSPALLDELERVLAYPKLAAVVADPAARVNVDGVRIGMYSRLPSPAESPQWSLATTTRLSASSAATIERFLVSD